MLDVQTQTEDVVSALQARHILVPDPDAVRGYLSRYPDITDLLLYVGERLQQEFNKDAQVALQLYRDYDSPDEYLTYYVRQEPYEDNLMDRIDSLDDEYGPELVTKTGSLLVTTDFRSPL